MAVIDNINNTTITETIHLSFEHPLTAICLGALLLFGFLVIRRPQTFKVLYRYFMNIKNNEEREEKLLENFLFKKDFVKNGTISISYPNRDYLVRHIIDILYDIFYNKIENTYKLVKDKNNTDVTWSLFCKSSFHRKLYNEAFQEFDTKIRSILKEEGWPQDKIDHLQDFLKNNIGRPMTKENFEDLELKRTPMEFMMWWLEATKNISFLIKMSFNRVNGDLNGLVFKGKVLEKFMYTCPSIKEV